jgi:hypothetical protein
MSGDHDTYFSAAKSSFSSDVLIATKSCLQQPIVTLDDGKKTARRENTPAGAFARELRQVRWHGPNLSQALRGVDARQASWRPPSTGTARWTIREIVLHVAGVMQRDGSSLLGSSCEAPLRLVNEEKFPLAGVSSDEEWQRDVEFLRAAYELLRRAVSEATPARLETRAPSRAYDREWTFLNVIYGVAFHNVYHAAQIVSLRRQQGTWTEWQP